MGVSRPPSHGIADGDYRLSAKTLVEEDLFGVCSPLLGSPLGDRLVRKQSCLHIPVIITGRGSKSAAPVKDNEQFIWRPPRGAVKDAAEPDRVTLVPTISSTRIDVCQMLGRRRRRRPNICPTLPGQRRTEIADQMNISHKRAGWEWHRAVDGRTGSVLIGSPDGQHYDNGHVWRLSRKRTHFSESLLTRGPKKKRSLLIMRIMSRQRRPWDEAALRFITRTRYQVRTSSSTLAKWIKLQGSRVQWIPFPPSWCDLRLWWWNKIFSDLVISNFIII